MIDTPIFFFYIETMHNLLIFSRFKSIFNMTVWNTIDDRYSILPLHRNEATFLAFAPFSEHFQYDSVDRYSIFLYYIERMHNLLIYPVFRAFSV